MCWEGLQCQRPVWWGGMPTADKAGREWAEWWCGVACRADGRRGGAGCDGVVSQRRRVKVTTAARMGAMVEIVGEGAEGRREGKTNKICVKYRKLCKSRCGATQFYENISWGTLLFANAFRGIEQIVHTCDIRRNFSRNCARNSHAAITLLEHLQHEQKYLLNDRGSDKK